MLNPRRSPPTPRGQPRRCRCRPTTSTKARQVAPPLKTAEAASEATKRLKPLLLLQVVERLQMQQCLIFCRTNLDCDNLEKFLNAKGAARRTAARQRRRERVQLRCFAGQRHNDEQRRNLKAFKEGDVRFLICTDVAARGIDIKELPYVISMTLPDKKRTTAPHRAGGPRRHDGPRDLDRRRGKREGVVLRQAQCQGKQLSTKLASAGGCCIWYDEPALLKGVEKRLGAQIESLDAFVARGKGSGGGAQFDATWPGEGRRPQRADERAPSSSRRR